MNRVWTPGDESQLRTLWGGDLIDIAQVLDRTPGATRNRANLLGLVKRRYS